ncbi:MAG: lamin tail domain-containing protein [Candidatus Acetothermia bacterium]
MNKKSLKYLFTAVIIFVLLGSFALAEDNGSVRISEIAWSGTEASTRDQWVELTNFTDSEVDLSGWELSWEGVKVPLGEEEENTLTVNNSTLQTGEALLLEMGGDETVATREADVIYEGLLSYHGERMVLKNDAGEEVDVVDASADWPAGGTIAEDDPPYATMELRDGGWVTCQEKGEDEGADGNPIYGSPGTPNEEGE